MVMHVNSSEEEISRIPSIRGPDRPERLHDRGKISYGAHCAVRQGDKSVSQTLSCFAG